MAKTDSLRGTLDLLVLKVLSRGKPRTGYAINQAIMLKTKGTLSVRNSSLYPALLRMESAGWISCSGKADRKGERPRIWLWNLTNEGRAQLRTEKARWLQFSSAVEEVLRRW
ncbi:MAG: helix-turn-helix transcriptional regulator [Acidobacteriota bacterium]